MRLAPVLAAQILLAAVVVPAQTAPTNFTVTPQSLACPIAFAAERRSAPAFSQASTTGLPATGPSLHLSFAPPANRRVFGVTLTIHGSAPGDHTVPASFEQADAQATVTLTRSVNEDSLTHVTVPRPASIQAIQWVELTRITFTNGSAWNASSASRCRATPELLQLVATAR